MTATTETSPSDLKHDLLDELDPRGVSLEETHISWVFLAGDDAYKVKKPVDLGFLDFSTAEKRHVACKAEVHLNRRLAPHVYHACVPITRDAAGRHHLDGPGEPVDWAVHMVRLDDRERADHLLAAGRLGMVQVERIAERLARFHAEARADEETASYGTVEVTERNVRENFAQTRASIGDYLRPSQVRELEAWQVAFLEREKELFEKRRLGGRVRDGHGDLRLEHVYLDAEGRVTIIDCIEFNNRFRFADVCADVAFLAMDLGWHGHVELAEHFLAAYARAAGDYDLYPLVDFYESYRAFVRAKVSSMLAADPGASSALRRRMAKEARRYYLLALASERRFLCPPMLIAVGGMIAAGKSTLADALAVELLAPVVDSDRARKQLLGVETTDKVWVAPWQGAYSPRVSEQVYAELFRRADAVLRSGRAVVLDASFRSRDEREAARLLAHEHRVPFCFVECRADRATCLERLARRELRDGVSDGRRAIFDDFVAAYEPADELPAGEHLVFASPRPGERPFAECVADLVARLPEPAARQASAA